MQPPVLTKRDFVRRYAAGEFGNASPTWNTLEEWREAAHPAQQLYHVRNRIAGAETWYDLWDYQVAAVWRKAARLYGAQNLYLSAMAPTDRTALQGEVCRSERHLELIYSTLRRPMRVALLLGRKYATGIIAVSLLRGALCPRSHEWLEYLLDEYPEHVVEFSAYEICWGTVPGFNTVFWEVRKY